MTERVLVCLLAKTRAHELTFASFEKQVLAELGADLALALTINEDYDRGSPYWQRALYKWTAPDPPDYGSLFDEAQQQLCQQRGCVPQDWRSLLRFRGTWAGRIHSAIPHPSASSILIFCRWLLLQGLLRDAVLDRYDRFIITRSDYIWLCPHPPLSMLGREHIWVPDDHHWSGINDRHAVVSREHLAGFLNGLEDILLRPASLMREMEQRDEWNDEQMLALHLRRENLLPKVREFPYVMYAAHRVGDPSPTWARGRYEPAVGHYVKYESEFRAARAMAALVRTREDWLRGDWLREDWRRAEFQGAPPPRPPIWRRCAYALDAARVRLEDQLSRPGVLKRGAGKLRQRLGGRQSPGIDGGVSSPLYQELSRKRAF